ncbi:MAG: hypothetical protein JWQ98_1562 [Chlorobi bacterium]|nr:hypothetical protein [Chlorobiota bacterium]
MGRCSGITHRGGWLAALLLLLCGSVLTAQVRTLNLREMVGSAGTIFIGSVAGVSSGSDEHGDIVTYTTFRVEQPIYGGAAGTVTVKQLGGASGGLSTRLEHMRYFRTGERVLVAFYPISSLGFTSPIGLYQAVWNVTSDGQVLGVGDTSLGGLDALLRRYHLDRNGGTVAASTFVSMIDDLLREAGKL